MECESRSVWAQRLFFLWLHTVFQTCQIHLLLLTLFPAPQLSVLLGKDYPQLRSSSGTRVQVACI